MYIKRLSIWILACFLAIHSTVGQERKDSVEVFFRQGKSFLDASFRNNGSSIDSLLALMRKRLEIPGYSLQQIKVMGSASPEGPISLNNQLAKKRAGILADYIRQHADIPDSLLSCDSKVSDWQTLLRIVGEHPDFPHREEFLSALQNVGKNRKGNASDTLLYKRLRSIRGGVPYWYMYHNLYPALRTSSLSVVYDYTPPQVPVEEKTDSVVPVPPVEVPPVVEPAQPDTTVVPVETDSVLREPMLAVRTNLLYTLATALNVGVEYYTRNPHWSILAHYTFPWWSNRKNHLFMQVLDGCIEPRFYFDGKAGHTGHYLSVYGQANLYDIGFNEELGWQGEGWSFGLGYGRVWQPWKNKKWKLEAFIRVGYYHSIYDPYHAGEPGNDKYYYDWEGPIENFVRRNHRLRWFGPTGLGITLSYDLLNRKVIKERK